MARLCLVLPEEALGTRGRFLLRNPSIANLHFSDAAHSYLQCKSQLVRASASKFRQVFKSLERESGRARERESETDRQTDRQTDREREREREGPGAPGATGVRRGRACLSLRGGVLSWVSSGRSSGQVQILAESGI